MLHLRLPLTTVIASLIALGLAHADISPETQAAIDQGLSALQTQNFSSAGACFQKARALGPASEVDSSIGQAEAKIPGRELRAICWLGAYLAAKPTATDAEAVKREIDSLQTKSQTRILALVQSAEDAAQGMPSGEPRDQALRSVAGLWESLDDETHARKTIDLIDSKGPKSDAFSTLACAYAEKAAKQFEQVDLAGMQRSLDQAQSMVQLMAFQDTYPQYRIAMAHLTIARQQVRTGDFSGARASMVAAQEIGDAITDNWHSEIDAAVTTAEIGLGRAQLKTGDAAGARETFALALKKADAVQRPNEKYDVLMDMADAQTKAGDLVDARASLATALPLVTVYNDAGHARMEIVRAQVKAGDLAAAQTTADLITEGNPSWRNDARIAIAEGQIKAGALEGARKSLGAALAAADLYENKGQGKFQAQRLIADAQTRAGDPTGALATLAAASKTADLLFPEADQKAWAQQGIAEQQFKAGDKAAAMETARLIKNADIQSETMRQLAGSPADIPSIHSEPMEPPRQSEVLGLSARINVDAWVWMLHENFDAPWFTAYSDFSDYMAMADQMQKTPVRNGPQAAVRPLDKTSALIIVGLRMTAAQHRVNECLRLQFKK